MGQKIKQRAVEAHAAKKEVLDELAKREARGREFRERCSEHNEHSIAWDGYDGAIVGFADRCGSPALLVYDYELMVQVNMMRDGWTRESAMEWIDYNVVGAFVGEGTPLTLYSDR